jgi:hypothetical protein
MLKRDVNVTEALLGMCEESRCAWYIEETSECAIKCIATRLEKGAVHVVWEKQLQPAM